MNAADLGRRLEDADSPAERLAAIAEALDALPELRRDTAAELVAAGFTHTEVAELAGITRARVSQILGALSAPAHVRNTRPEEVTQ